MTASKNSRSALQKAVARIAPGKYYCAIFLVTLCMNLVLFLSDSARAEQNAPPPVSSEKLILEKALMCEGLEENSPRNQAVVFSAELGRIFCFSKFNPVPEDTFVFHNWYLRDKLHFSKKLALKKPQWTTFSSISIRVNDKGPWRVEILDAGEKRLRTLRFSIVD